MVFKTDKQRKAFFATRNFKGQTMPTMVSSIPKLPLAQREFIADKIRKNISEGKPQKQAIAIAFSQARKRFGNSRLLPKLGNPNGITPKRTRNLLILILGTAIALRLFRDITRSK